MKAPRAFNSLIHETMNTRFPVWQSSLDFEFMLVDELVKMLWSLRLLEGYRLPLQGAHVSSCSGMTKS